MKSLIIGANGGVGQHLVRKLKARDVDFTAGVRKEEQVEALKQMVSMQLTLMSQNNLLMN